MATELSISIVATAAIGGAMRAFTQLGGGVQSLRSATRIATDEHRRLGGQIDRAMTRGSGNVGELIGQYYRLGDSIRSVNRVADMRTRVDAHIENARQIRSSLMGEAMDLVGLGATVAMPVKLAIDFESAMADVKKVVDFDTPQQFKQMQDDILRLTHTIPMAGTEIAQIVAAGGQSGVARENLLGFATNAAKMGVAFDMAAGDAGKAMATLSNVLKVPIENIDRLGDAINHLSDNANSNAADIVNVLTRVGGTARQLKLTENQAAALGSTFLSMGKPPELAAQAMEGMLSTMAMMKTGKYDDDLARLGYKTSEFARAMNENAQGAITQFLQKIKELPEDDQYPFLTKLFGSNYNDDVQLLANSIGEYGRQLDLLNEKDPSGNLSYLGSMTREFENQAATTANHIRTLKNQLVDLGVKVGSAVLPTLVGLVGQISPIVTRLIEWTSANPALVKGLVTVVASLFAFRASGIAVRFLLNGLSLSIFGLGGQLLGFVGIFQKFRLAFALFSMNKPASALQLFGLTSRQARTAVLAFGKGMTFVKSGITTLTSAFGRLGSLSGVFNILRVAAIGFGKALLTTPIGWFALALAGVALVVYKYWTPISSFFLGLWDGIKSGFAPLLATFSGIGTQLSATFAPVVAVLGGLWASISPLVAPIIDWFGQFFAQSQMAGEGARSMGQTVGAVIIGIVNIVVGVASTIIGVWSGALSTLFSVAGSIWNGIRSLFTVAVAGLRAVIRGFSPVSAFSTAFLAVWGFLSGLVGRFRTFGVNIIQGLIGGIKSMAGAVTSAISSVVGNVAGRAKSMLGINSPSRVFRQFGSWVSEGLAIGIDKGGQKPVSAIGSVASGVTANFGAKMGNLSAHISTSVGEHQARMTNANATNSQSQGNITIHFNPTINAGGGDVGKIERALQISQAEFEKMFARMQQDKLRRAY